MLFSLIAALTFAAAPQASTDCLKSYSGPICRTRALDPLRMEMDAKYAVVLAKGNRQATWRARHDAVMRRLKAGIGYDGSPLAGEALEQAFRDHIGELDKAIAQANDVRGDIRAPSARSETCMAKWLDQGCRVVASGMLRDKAGRAVLWQMMEGASAEDGTGAGIVLWADSGIARLVGFSFDGVTYEAPRLTRDGMIWVPGRMMDTGNGNADLLYRWDDTAAQWRDIELESWRDTLPGRLPNGFGVWKGVAYDFDSMPP